MDSIANLHWPWHAGVTILFAAAMLALATGTAFASAAGVGNGEPFPFDASAAARAGDVGPIIFSPFGHTRSVPGPVALRPSTGGQGRITTANSLPPRLSLR
jgi:hypothetical protein